jgi:hypothetical protein
VETSDGAIIKCSHELCVKVVNKSKPKPCQVTLPRDNTDTLSAVQETFCGIHGPQFDIHNLDTVYIFENISDIAIVQVILME